jgi:hypothetical protein
MARAAGKNNGFILENAARNDGLEKLPDGLCTRSGFARSCGCELPPKQDVVIFFCGRIVSIARLQSIGAYVNLADLIGNKAVTMKA